MSKIYEEDIRRNFGWGIPTECLPTKKMPVIMKVIFNSPATIILWGDGTKTVCKTSEGDMYNPEVGFAMCIAKKYMGSRHQIEKKCKPYYGEYTFEVEDTKNWFDVNGIYRAMDKLGRILGGNRDAENKPDSDV